ncbi:MAG: hypothetical protein J5744_09575 [Oscillospiraceae bacterium]|nr:hypothetical protein [Oscillospiraceae bacterium]
MNSKKLKEERVKLFRDAVNFRKTDRIPHFANAVTWKVFDAGHTLDETMTDFDLMEKCVLHFLDKYPVDAILDVGIRNQFNVTEAFGEGSYYYYDEEVVGVHDHAHCTPETLQEYMDDPTRYAWEVILPKKYGESWEQKTTKVWKKTFSEYIRYVMFVLHMAKVMDRYGLPGLSPNNPMKGAVVPAVEELMSNLLGIQQLSVAMRRSPELLDAFIERWEKERMEPIYEKIRAAGGPNYKYCFDSSILMLAHTVMNSRQFERFYWPYLKKLLDTYAEMGQNVRIFAEGSILRFTEYFRDYPKGLLTFHLEQDDPFEFREALPNAAIMGGMTTDLLSYGTPEECVAYAKKLCDELGREGGFIFSENKMLSYRNDAKSENMLAACNFVRDYRL